MQYIKNSLGTKCNMLRFTRAIDVGLDSALFVWLRFNDCVKHVYSSVYGQDSEKMYKKTLNHGFTTGTLLNINLATTSLFHTQHYIKENQITRRSGCSNHNLASAKS